MSLVPGLGRPSSTRQTGALENQVRAIFLFGDGGVIVEPTVSQATAFMEPIDIENGEYDAVFDDTGRQYESGSNPSSQLYAVRGRVLSL